MTTIELRFPAHRFHATPWGRHVNEGVVEWPPAPYRLIRALYDSWKRKNSEIPESTMQGLFEGLASEPPRFLLPAAVATHTRSYLSDNTVDPNEKSLIFDGFVAFDPNARCHMTWPFLTLTNDQRTALNRLLSSLNYLGRSESWIEAALFEGSVDGAIRCDPANQSNSNGDLIHLACVTPLHEYDGRRPWMQAITYTTAELLNDRRSSPPALRRVPYVRSHNAVLAHVTKKPERSPVKVDAILVALSGTVLPLVTATIEIAEQIRARLMGIHKRIMGDATLVSSIFSGKSPDGNPATGHRHAFILPLGNGKGRIDRVLIYTRAPDGFDRSELRAILGLRSLYQASSDRPLRAVVSWKGTAENNYVRVQAKSVISTTPFVTLRHWRKGRGTPGEFLKEEIRRELRNHALPDAIAVELLPQAPGLFEWIEYRRNRKGEIPRAGYGFRLEFAAPVRVPFSLGYGCHFGLGQFARAD